MSVYIDRKYLLLVSSKLRNFKDKGNDLYNFSCNFCGDSQRNKTRARGYMFRKGDHYFFMCHNCNASMGFAKFLREVEPGQYKEYLLERFGDKGNVAKFEERKAKQATNSTPFVLSGPKPREKLKHQTQIKIPSVSDLNDHPLKEYIKSRKIPERFWKEIFYAQDFKEFMDKTFPNHGKELIENDPRLVLFYRNRDGDITNVAGRVFEDNTQRLRYITVKVSEERKIFGIERLNIKSTIYVVEGQFDSFFLENCVATGDSNLVGTADYLYTLTKAKRRIVLVYDNEDRNAANIKQMEKAIASGYSVVIFPKSVNGKDLNQMIENGWCSEELQNIVDDNTFNGLKAKLKLNDWRKI